VSKHHAVEVYKRRWSKAPHILVRTTRRKWPVTFICVTLQERFHWVGGVVGPRVGLDLLVKTKVSYAAENRTPIIQLHESYRSYKMQVSFM